MGTFSFAKVGIKRSFLKKKLGEVKSKEEADALSKLLNSKLDEYSIKDATFIASKLIYTDLDIDYTDNPQKYSNVPSIRIFYTTKNNKKKMETVLSVINGDTEYTVLKPNKKKSSVKNGIPLGLHQKVALVNVYHKKASDINKRVLNELISLRLVVKSNKDYVLTKAGDKIIEKMIT